MTKSLYINGGWRSGHGDEFSSINPSDGSEIWSGRSANEADVEAAFEAAHNAFEGWSRTPMKQRMPIVARYKGPAWAS